MRPAMEPGLDMGENDLMQILSHVVEEVRDSVGQDVDGAELVYGLLNAPWLQSLLKVYEGLQQYLKSSTTPHILYASGLSLEILSDLRALPYPSHEARELYTLLAEPHLQALLSAHDVVGLKDYEPILPPLPEDLSVDEEAMRIVCLVKNKQPLKSRVGRGLRSHWDTLRQRFIPSQKAQSELLCSKMHKDAPPKLIITPSPVPLRPQPCSKHAIGSCKLCQNCAFRNRSLSCSAPCVCNSVVIDDFSTLDKIENDHDIKKPILPVHPHCTLSPWTHMTHSSLTPCCYHPSILHPFPIRMACYARTAPPSPMHQHRLLGAMKNPAPVELAKQESLDELRSIVQQAANRVERNSQDVQVLGQRMADATELMSESVQENAQALALLAQVVEKLQGLAAAGSATSEPLTPPVVHGPEAFKEESKESTGNSAQDAHPVSGPWEVPAHGEEDGGIANLCRTSTCGAKAQGIVASTTAASSPRADASAEERMDGKSYKGATIRRDETTGEIYVARVIHGGLADRSGLLHAGDKLVEVNSQPVFGLEPEQIIQILANSHGTVMFKVVPITDRPVNNQTMLYVRTLTDYSPQQDPAIPCADAGMAFRKGDLLEIVDQTDALWWQAKKLPCSSACAGLIPSASLLKRKQREFWWSQPFQPHTCIKTLSTVDEEDDILAIDVTFMEADEEAFESEELREEENEFSATIEGIYLAGFRRSLRLCRRRRIQSGVSGLSCSLRCPSSCYSALANPYEEVVRYQRHPEDTHRLIALLGPSGVGVNELRRRLIEINPKTYQGATPHTTRPPKSHEELGREYHYISREKFENMVYSQCFVEYGEHRGHFYGTSVEAVKDVLAAGKICVIDIEPYAIDSVRTHELRAYIIYIKPPPIEQLKRTRVNSQIITSYFTTRPFRDEDFQEIEEAGRRMEQHYGQFFDHVIVNDGLQASCVQLLTAVRRAQDEPQWVPASWIRPSDRF